MREHPDERVTDWLNAQAAETLYLSTISLAELQLGIENLPVGKRRQTLEAALVGQIVNLFKDRIVPFDVAAAQAYGKVVMHARKRGHTISVADGQIASIAVAHGLEVATRDTTPFNAAGLAVINPWVGRA